MRLPAPNSIRVRIALLIVLSLGVVAGALSYMGYRASVTRSVIAAEAAMGAAADHAAAIVDEYLAPIPGLLAATDQAALRGRDEAAFTELALTLLGAHPKYYQLYRGSPDGVFLGVARADPQLLAQMSLPAEAAGGFVRSRVDAASGEQRVAWRAPGDAAWTDVAEARRSTYDPRLRPWYLGARDRPGMQWTAPYRFSFAPVVGVTAALATRDKAGGLLTITGIDVLIDDLDQALGRIPVPGQGRLFLAYADGTLLSHAALEGLRSGRVSTAPRLIQLAGTADEIDLRLFERAGGDPKLVRVDLPDQGWLGTVRPLASSALSQTVVATAAPIPALTAAGRAQAVQELLVGLGLMAVAVVLTVWLAGPALGRPIERLAAAAYAIRRDGIGAETALPQSSIDEIQELSISFDAMVDALRAREAELTRLNAELEQRVALRTAELAEARDRAEDAARAKATFLATMSHEIRTPMTGVVGMLDLLADSGLDAGQREMVEVCTSSAAMLRTIIDDILDFSKIEAGKLALEALPIELESFAGDVCDLLAPRAEAAGLELVIDLDPAAPAQITGDPARLRQILVNLVGNAIKFTKAGHVALRIAPFADGLIEIAVADTGIGLTEEQRGRLFRAFEQAEAGTTRQFGGTGLGLAICRRLAELMGGTIGVDSEPGAGSTFWLRIPPGTTAPRAGDRPLDGLAVSLALGGPALARLAARDLAAAGATLATGDAPGDAAILVTDDPARAGGAAGRVLLLPRARRTPALLASLGAREASCALPVRPAQLIDAVAIAAGRRQAGTGRIEAADEAGAPLPPALRVLVAEDTPNSRLAIARMLEREGLTPVLCENGAVAWRALQQERFDLLITDCNMPEMDGYALTRNLRRLEAADPARPRTTVCALSASVLQDEIDQCFQAGMDSFLAKPVVRKELGRMLRAQLAERIAALGPAMPATPPVAVAATAPAAAPTAEPEEPVLDLSEFEALFGGLTDDLRTIVREFAVLAREQVAQLRDEIARQDGQAAQTAHALAGNALSTGARALGLRVRGIEIALKRGAPAEATAAVPGLETALESLEARVAAL